MLPLNNGFHQIVKGLSVDQVTGRFGNIDMGPVMGEIRTAAKNDKMVAKLRAPKVVTGETDMLIGIKYNILSPEPIFTTLI